MWRPLSALLCTTLLCASGLIPEAQAAAQPIDQISIIVNDGVILNSDVDARINDLRFQAEQRKAAVPDEKTLRQQAREQLILETLQMQLAERNGIRADDNAVIATLTTMARQNGMTLDKFRSKLDSTPGTSFANVRSAVEREQVIERLRQRRMGERIRITDADIAQLLSTPAGSELNRQLDEQLKPAEKPAPVVVKPAIPQFLVTQILVPMEDDASPRKQLELTTMAERLLADGWTVHGFARGPQALAHARFRAHAVDVADEAAVRAAIAGIAAEGRIDLLVNNAGTASLNSVLLTPGEVAATLMRVNYLGAFHCLQAAGKAMVRQRSGLIVNLTTVAVPLRLEGEAAYVASKAAVEALTQVAAAELAPQGVRVLAAGFGPVDTALTRAVPRGKLAEINERIGRPQGTTIPQAVDFLVALIGDASVPSGSVRYLASF